MAAPLYLRPDRLDDALAALAEARPRPLTLLAGGTDLYPARVGRPPEEDVLDIDGLDGELRGITLHNGLWRIGTLTRWADLTRADLPTLFDGLRGAAREVGGLQIQNAGTLGGNLCTASPAADATPNLLALDATVELASARRGRREMPLDEFVQGYRRTALTPDELLTAILVPAPGRGSTAATAFLKLGARRYLVISIVSVALAVEVTDGRITRAGVAVGACAPVAKRLPLLEARLLGERPGSGLAGMVDEQCLTPLSPIDDIRGSAAYRRDACLTLLRRGLGASLSSRVGGSAA